MKPDQPLLCLIGSCIIALLFCTACQPVNKPHPDADIRCTTLPSDVGQFEQQWQTWQTTPRGAVAGLVFAMLMIEHDQTRAIQCMFKTIEPHQAKSLGHDYFDQLIQRIADDPSPVRACIQGANANNNYQLPTLPWQLHIANGTRVDGNKLWVYLLDDGKTQRPVSVRQIADRQWRVLNFSRLIKLPNR